MTIFQCTKCKKTFDDKYLFNNEEGLRETLLAHIKRHKEDSDIEFFYFKQQKSTRDLTK